MQEILEHMVLNCCDVSRFAKDYFDKDNIENKLFCIYDLDENNELQAHIFPTFRYSKDDKWKVFEAVNAMCNGIKEYNSLNDLLRDQKLIWWNMTQHYVQIDEQIPDNLSIPQLVDFLATCPQVQLDNDYKINSHSK